MADFAVQRADGAELALRFYQFVAIEGDMPDGGSNRVQIAVASIPALLAMKGYAIANRAAARWVINTAVSTSPAETFFGGSARNCWLGR